MAAGVPYGLAQSLGVVLVVTAITALSVIIGELVPKQIAMSNPEGIAARVAPSMRMVAKIGIEKPIVVASASGSTVSVRPRPCLSTKPTVTCRLARAAAFRVVDADGTRAALGEQLGGGLLDARRVLGAQLDEAANEAVGDQQAGHPVDDEGDDATAEGGGAPFVVRGGLGAGRAAAHRSSLCGPLVDAPAARTGRWLGSVSPHGISVSCNTGETFGSWPGNRPRLGFDQQLKRRVRAACRPTPGGWFVQLP